MSLERRLGEELVRRDPERAAAALEQTDRQAAAELLSAAAAGDAAPVLQRMTPQFAAGVLETFGDEEVRAVIERLPLDAAARLLRRLPAERATGALDAMDSKRARALHSLLRFPEGSAGALMDPDVLALPESLTAREALDRVRKMPESARYNLYILDAQQRLVGVVNLRELLLARPADRLADVMVRDPQHLDAHAERSEVVAHRGWREVHSLPVVDQHGGYLGAVRYRTLRALERSLFGRKVEDTDSRAALGELFKTSAGALMDALSRPASTSTRQ